MAKRLLLRSQKNGIFKIIRDGGLNPNDFEWVEVKTTIHSDLTGYNTVMGSVNQIRVRSCHDFFMTFNVDSDGNPELIYRPASENSILPATQKINWAGVGMIVSKWIANLKRELDEPDLWSQIAEYHLDGADASEDTTNEKFSKVQIEKLTEALNQVKAYLVEELQPNTEQMQIIDEKIDYLIETSKRMGKKDWMNICFSVFASFALQLSLPPERANAIWLVIKEAVGNAIKLLQ